VGFPDPLSGTLKEITDQIIDHTDGVPLFIEELTKAVVERGVLTEATHTR